MNAAFSAESRQQAAGIGSRPLTGPVSRLSRTTRVLGAGLIAASVALTAAALTSAAGGQQSTSSSSGAGESRLILDWNRFAQQIIAADNGYENPLPATRALSTMHLAMHDAINAAAPRYATYVIRARDHQADPAIAAAQAAHDVLVTMYPSQKSALQVYLKQYLDDAGIGQSVAKGVALGKRAAADIVAARTTDNSANEESYREGNAPRQYRFWPRRRRVRLHVSIGGLGESRTPFLDLQRGGA